MIAHFQGEGGGCRLILVDIPHTACPMVHTQLRNTPYITSVSRGSSLDYLRLSANPHLSEATTIRRSDDHPKSQTMYYVKKPWKVRNLPVGTVHESCSAVQLPIAKEQAQSGFRHGYGAKLHELAQVS